MSMDRTHFTTEAPSVESLRERIREFSTRIESDRGTDSPAKKAGLVLAIAGAEQASVRLVAQTADGIQHQLEIVSSMTTDLLSCVPDDAPKRQVAAVTWRRLQVALDNVSAGITKVMDDA